MLEPFPAEAVALIESLRAQVAQRDVVIGQLLERVAGLEARVGRNSRNSSAPPSSDNPFTKKPAPKSLRPRSGRRPGKQPGQPGSGLEARADPDIVRVHVPGCCAGCGADLGQADVVGEQRRQVFDLPAIRVEVTEHRAQTRRCGCGRETSAVFPDQARAPRCYGPALAAVATYLLARQHLPVARVAELLSCCMGVRVSTGWVAGLLPNAEARLTGFAALTRAQLREAPVAHFDETGARVAGKLWWIHVACTQSLTSYHRAPSRGSTSADLGQVLPGFAGVAVHDGLTSYRRYELDHGLCNAHHLRELVALTETSPDRAWPQAMIDLLVEIKNAVDHAQVAGQTMLAPTALSQYQRRYRALISQGWVTDPPPPPTGRRGRPTLGTARSLLRRLDIYQDDVLRFAADFTVPFDNNQAERDIRMIRLQQKISGTWRSEAGADAFLAVRSYLSTAHKQGHDALEVLRNLFTGTPWLPAPT